MKNLLKTILISGLLSSAVNIFAQDTNKPIPNLSGKVVSTTPKTIKQEKPIDALSSKSTTIIDVKKDTSSQGVPILQPKAVLSDKKEIKP